LLDQVGEKIRKKHYSIRTEQAYVDWIRRFSIHHGKRHPKDMGESEISQYLSHLASDLEVSASTRNQALCALVFLYKQVLGIGLGDFGQMDRTKKPERLPTVLSREEVARVLVVMSGTHQLMAKLLCGCGLRLIEHLRLRVKDLDFGQNEILIRDGKGMKNRATMLPEQLVPSLADNLKRVKMLHDSDLKSRLGEVFLPFALERKYPNSGREWGWQYVFPSVRVSEDPRSGKKRRHHRDENRLAESRARDRTRSRHGETGQPSYLSA
jgi:integron integrase